MWSLWTLSHTIIVVRLTDNYGPFSIAFSRYTVESFKSLLPSLLYSRLSIRCDVLGLIVSASIIIPQALRHFRSCDTWATCGGWFSGQLIFSVIYFSWLQGASGWGSSTGRVSGIQGMSEQLQVRSVERHRAQELCESRGGRPGLPSLINLRLL